MSDVLTYAIILAAGRGERMLANKNKMLLEIGGNSLLELCLTRFQENECIDHIFAVVASEDILPDNQSEIEQKDKLEEKYPKLASLVAGGKTRQDSVYNGLEAVKKHAADYCGRVLVLIHDGARCFVPSAVLESVTDALKTERCAVVAAVPVTDTIRQISDCRLEDLQVPREHLWQMQTPQAADLDILLHAFAHADQEGFLATDDIALLLRIGYPVRVVRGDRRNIKLTTPDDFEMARLLYETEYFKE
ncbi:MAG: 2-C-methyl-D-erythritol 4-phosphate cytidylyltransferase [Eubacteriales bacterium]|nr:2-C-methyl-D-erythritol 4-phosphate cytidylyltransferase [Eubacteriales bacterium]